MLGESSGYPPPPIAELIVLDGGTVLARPDNEAKSEVIGSYGDLIRNWKALLSCAGLSKTERIEADSMFAAKIGYLFDTVA